MLWHKFGRPSRIEPSGADGNRVMHFDGHIEKKPGDFADRHIPEVDLFAKVLQDIVGIGPAASEDIECDQAQVGVSVCRAMTFVKDDNGRKTRGRIVTEVITDLRDDVGSRLRGGFRHGLKHLAVVQAGVAGNIPTIDQ